MVVCCSDNVRAVLLSLSVALLLAGCEREGVVASSTAERAKEQVARPLPPDQARAERMRSFLDEDNRPKAMELARQLMRSKEREVRLEVVATLGWLGRPALHELTEMLADRDDFVQTLAQNNWLATFDVLPTDEEKARAILDAVRAADSPDTLSGILIKASDLEAKESLPLLERIILSYEGKPASSCAKAIFEHLAGEPWSSSGRTQKLIQGE